MISVIEKEEEIFYIERLRLSKKKEKKLNKKILYFFLFLTLVFK